MQVPFVDLKIQYRNIKAEVDEAVHGVLDSAMFIMGPHVKAFEEGFAKLHGAKYCIGTSSGTDSLHLALWALGVGRGDRVIVPVNTFIATAEAVSLCGATPVFVDCDEYFNIDVKLVKVFLQNNSTLNTQHSTLPKAIIPVHLYGQPADMIEILDLAKEFNLNVIEDACQAHLAKWQMAPQWNKEKKDIPHGGHGGWQMVGTSGNAGAFSFFPGKNLGAYGEAGATVTNDDELYAKMVQIHDHGSARRYVHDTIGHNYRMEAIQGAVLNVKLKYIEAWTKLRQEHAALYNELLKDVGEITTPSVKDGRTHSYHLYVVRCERRDELKEFLEQQGVAAGLHYPIPLHLQKAYAHLGYRKGDFPAAEKSAGEILSLPIFPELTAEQIRYVVDTIKAFYARTK
jgi:dTDP-4-amino-4,6-dideoxygalactose transaminase